MGLRDTRTMSSFVPRRGRDNNADRRQTPQSLFGTIIRTPAKGPFAIFRAPSGVKIIRVSLLVDAAVNSFNESFWTFQMVNMSNNNAALNAVKVSTAATKISANQPYDILADTGSTVNDATGAVVNAQAPATVPSQILKSGDVLGLLVEKTGSPLQLSNLELFVEYEVTGLTTTTSSSTTITTSTTSSTSSTTSTTTTVSTSSSTSSSTTTLSTTTSTTITTSTTTTSSSTTTTSSSTTTTSSSTSTTTSTSSTISTSTTIT